MPLVGLSIRKLFAQPVVEICNEVGIVIASVRRGKLLHGIFFPKYARISKGAETALRTHSRSGKDHYLFSFHLADLFHIQRYIKNSCGLNHTWNKSSTFAYYYRAFSPKEVACSKSRYMNKVSYALGLGIGRQLQDLCGEDLNLEDFAQAVKDIYTGGELAIDEIEGQQMVIEYLQRRDAEKKAEQAAAGEVAKKASEDILKENSKKAGVVTLPSGLQYMVIKEGTGRSPKATDNVKCHYEGTLIDGTLFDSSKKRGEPATFPLNGVIKGWTEGVQLMKEGATYRFFIPYDLAYGANGAGSAIPPYAALIFDVELIEVL